MDFEIILAAGWFSLIVVLVVFVGAAAIFYAIVKKKRDYNSTGIPKLVEKSEEKEGSTENM